ncbi:Lipase/thioesterase family protein [Tolypocladium paradoxum]|uniref:Lipase/thioesterase family protein n=1 Tax=Tolypocladium paradoxum TaxID=94208 RepID=A0A2S4KY74_9HYPO|nr:Lipase/thioesterase family protein [Tolypocladium paradoxum]
MQTKTVVKQRLSLVGKLDVLPALVSIISTALFSALTGITRSQQDAPSLFLHVAYAILRKATQRLSPLQLQWISPATDVLYERYARSARVKPETVDLGHGAKGHWIGDKHAQNVLIWYHGGGFCLPANIGYFKFWAQLIKSSRAAGKDVAVFALTYTLAPHAQYPTQLTQAVEALRYILTQTHCCPARVLLGGDSAGGNLVVGVLSHLAHPHPAIAELKLAEPLAGAAAIAPWTSLDENHSEQDIYYGGDLITPYVGGPWSRAYLGSATRDYYTDASDAPSSWFKDFPVKQILVLGGQNEVLMPVIEDFVQKLKAGFPAVELFIGRREAHVAPVYNIYVGDKTETEQGKKLKSWLRDVL